MDCKKNIIKIWIDDIRTAPYGYVWIKSVYEAKQFLFDNCKGCDVYIDTDHDAGDYQADGGDYVQLFHWLEYFVYCNPNYFNSINVSVHSMNPVGRQNIDRIVQRNGWKVNGIR